jgi:hypothetical protein
VVGRGLRAFPADRALLSAIAEAVGGSGCRGAAILETYRDGGGCCA